MVNKAIILGNLGQDPELRYTSNGSAVSSFSLATNERWNDKDGQKQERTEWHRIVVWGKQAELCSEYLSKGRTVYIEGRIQTREWEDKEGQKRYTTEIVAQNIQFIGGNAGASGGQYSGQSGSQSGNQAGNNAQAKTQNSPAPQAPGNFGPSQDDDIPF